MSESERATDAGRGGALDAVESLYLVPLLRGEGPRALFENRLLRPAVRGGASRRCPRYAAAVPDPPDDAGGSFMEVATDPGVASFSAR